MTFRVYTDTHITPEPWISKGLCTQVNGDTFFPDDPNETAKAKTICGRCDVVAQCLTYALRTRQTEGVWGGKTPRQLRTIRHARNKP